MVSANVELQQVAIGALLHDIGKFAQRAGVPAPTRFASFGVEDYGAHGAHAKWSAEFVEQCVPERWRQCAHAVLTHHRPREAMAKVIAVADHLAATEREDAEIGEYDPRTAQLQSVFARLRLPGSEGSAASSTASESRVYPLAPLALDDRIIFPRTSAAAGGSYADLWTAFVGECKALRDAGLSFTAYLETLLHLLERYTWCVPSATYRSVPDVSLFDHLRVTAALAVCLWQQSLPRSTIDRWLAQRATLETDRQLHFTLLCGDLSGVQRFLYRVTSRGAVRGLRGRSLYLQLVTEAAADRLLEALELPTVNQIYVGGGRFYILAPLLDEARLTTLRQDLESRFLAAHGGQLALALADVSLAPADFQRFSQKWREVGQAVGEQKRRRFAAVIATDYEMLFAPHGRGGPLTSDTTCDICGQATERGTIEDRVLRCERCVARSPVEPVYVRRCDVCREEIIAGEVDERTVKCEVCIGFEDLGGRVARLRSADQLFLTISKDLPPAEAPGWQRTLARLGFRYDLDALPHPERPDALVYRVNDTRFRPQAHGFRFLNILTPHVDARTLDDWPRDEPRGKVGDVKPFSVLVDQAVGLKRLGVLRMDVDSLGMLFGAGLGERATPSRIATLSRMLRLFFEGWLNAIGERVERDRQHLPADRTWLADQQRLYAIYTGGDDLFVVGSWDRLPLYAREVRTQLAEFAAWNPAVTISAGLVLADVREPLYQTAEDAKRALDDEAKEHERGDGRRKDAFSIFGHTLGWEEFPAVERSVTILRELIAGDDGPSVPRAVIGALAGVAAQYDRDRPKQTRPGQVHYGRWHWLAAYTFQRQLDRLRPSPNRDRLRDLFEELRRPELVPHLGLIARWTEFLVRREERDASV